MRKDNIIKSDDIAKTDIAITYNIRKMANCTAPWLFQILGANIIFVFCIQCNNIPDINNLQGGPIKLSAQ